MSSPLFRVKEHIIHAQHIREYPRATASSQADSLQLAVKQYIPNYPVPPSPDAHEPAITVIGAHANGFPKELYEALWADLLAATAARGVRIRSIWITDAAWQGYSGILNADKLGNDPSWHDYARDMLHMINHFHAHMPPPLVAVGHSFGANALAYLSSLHPRLLAGLVLLDPVITASAVADERSPGLGPARLSAQRRDVWPSRAAAAAAFRRSPFYRAWDPRVLDAWIQHGVRETSTGAVLATTKHQEVFTFLRPVWPALDPQGQAIVHPVLVPELDSRSPEMQPHPFYRPECAETFSRLPALRPEVLYMFGGASRVSPPEGIREKLRVTGRRVEGAEAAANVRAHTLEGKGHLFPMEDPKASAEFAADWISATMLPRYCADLDQYQAWARDRTLVQKTTLDDEWLKRMGVKAKTSKL